jgi:hypothetical protein
VPSRAGSLRAGVLVQLEASASRLHPGCSRTRQLGIPRTSRRRSPENPRPPPEIPATRRAKNPLSPVIQLIPAQPGTTKTGLSRRRSRVRVPSLPSLEVSAFEPLRPGQVRRSHGTRARRELQPGEDPRDRRLVVNMTSGPGSSLPRGRCRAGPELCRRYELGRSVDQARATLEPAQAAYEEACCGWQEAVARLPAADPVES